MATSTEIVAWWGAIVATIVLVWDIFKWKFSGPKLKANIRLNANYSDAKVLKTEKIEGGEVTYHEEYCHIELINIGNLPVTIMSIYATHSHKKNSGSYGITDQAFTEHFGKKIPYVIPVGEVWSCRLPMDRYKKLLKYGRPEIQLIVSHRSKPLIIRASKKANKALNSPSAGTAKSAAR